MSKLTIEERLNKALIARGYRVVKTVAMHRKFEPMPGAKSITPSFGFVFITDRGNLLFGSTHQSSEKIPEEMKLLLLAEADALP